MITSEEEDEHQENAGNQFGGRKGKKQKKRGLPDSLGVSCYIE